MTEQQIDMYAIRVALGNNGGMWSEHYTAEQKEHWRGLIRSLVKDIEADVK